MVVNKEIKISEKKIGQMHPHIYENSNLFSAINMKSSEDYVLINKLLQECGEDASWPSYVKFLKENPEFKKINNMYIKNGKFL